MNAILMVLAAPILLAMQSEDKWITLVSVECSCTTVVKNNNLNKSYSFGPIVFGTQYYASEAEASNECIERATLCKAGNNKAVMKVAKKDPACESTHTFTDPITACSYTKKDTTRMLRTKWHDPHGKSTTGVGSSHTVDSGGICAF